MGGYETAAPAGYAPALEMVRMLATRPDVE
jgi:hypothetical protein